MRKLLSLFLAAVMVILTVPMTAATVSAETEGLYTYEIADGCATITDVDKTISGNVTLPDKLGGYPVTGIGDHAFAHCKSLISITISDGVTSIGNEVFYLCESLTHITIPDSVTRIWQSVFNHCRHLTSIEVSEGNTAYSSIEGVLFSKDATYLIRYPENKDCSKYIIPDSVTGIGNDAFNGCMSLTSITIPTNVTNIGFNAFYRCTSLTSITIPDSVTRIDNGVFLGCTSLTSITIPDSVTIIGDNAFRRCTSLTSITIPNSVTEIFGGAFAHCTSLTSITIPDGVTSILSGAFSNCTSLASITIPDSVISVSQWAFEGCTNLTDVYYAGSREDWGKISIDSDNTALTEAPRIHFNTSSAKGHYEIVTTTPPLVLKSDTARRFVPADIQGMRSPYLRVTALYNTRHNLPLARKAVGLHTKPVKDVTTQHLWHCQNSVTPMRTAYAFVATNATRARSFSAMQTATAQSGSVTR